MSDVKWTKEQEQAIYEKGNNMLVAAAAGSGKTAVLVERIINKILKDNIDIDKLLIVTFTNAAAAEMKERILNAIYKKLEEEPDNKNLQRQIILLNKASICTIDSFCLDIVKNNFFELDNISPNFRIADTSEIEIMKLEVLDELFEKKYEENNEQFIKLINIYTSYRDDTPLKDMIIKIYTYIQSNPFPKKWLEEHIEMFNLKEELDKDFSKTQWGEILLQEAKEEIIDDLKNLEIARQLLLNDEKLEPFIQTIEQDIKMLEMLDANLENWDKAFKMYKLFSFSDWSRKRVQSEEKDEAKNIRDNIKKKFKNKLDKIFVCESKQANEDIYEMYLKIKDLEQLIIEFETEFSKKKREKNLVDFNDIEHFALQILLREDSEGKLCTTEIAKKYQEQFEEIAIDEYQDSNMVQEYIMNAVSRNNNIFMVGDVKQSIYKFRQAMPELFLNKYYNYSEKNEDIGFKIKLFKNFRSRKNVLDFTNIIFENIMEQQLGDVDYTEEEFLNLGAEDYKEISQNLKTEVDIIDLKKEKSNSFDEEDDDSNIENNEEDTLENIELEARFTANKIKDLMENNYQIYDRKKESFRNITYKDIVILLRSTKDKANVFERELTNLNIPVFSDTSQEYLNSIEIETIMSLLKIIDNPVQDIPLVTVLRSSIFGFTDNELIRNKVM
ncbi:MAG: UvrD-helicase domain-containing protein [Clostridia bacterium]|nr:UvrD-helicase domain-containing protein [Clostridia bacterium]